ncbi:MAG: ExeA family protein [Candidatus Aminicenantia bacterium]
MYEAFYGFKENPFSITPDPKYFFFSKDHEEALSHIIFAINQGEGFIVLIGGIGTGKTTISRLLIERLRNFLYTSLILNPFLTETELLGSILWDFNLIPAGNTKKELIDQLNKFLLNEVAPSGKRAVVIIDEAQNLSLEVMEQIRLLSNLETDKEKLLQILLIGQEELAKKLTEHRLRQLNGRITTRYFLSPLQKKEIKDYIQHRLKIANPSVNVYFTKDAIKEIYKFSKGVPRLINMLCDRALLAGFVKNTSKIDRNMVIKARKSLVGEKEKEFERLIKPKNGLRKIFSFFKRKPSIDFTLSGK